MSDPLPAPDTLPAGRLLDGFIAHLLVFGEPRTLEENRRRAALYDEILRRLRLVEIDAQKEE